MKIENVEIMFKALADKSRLKIIQSLSAKPQYLEEIAQRLNLAVSTVSFHLKKLEKAGLISKQKEQYYVIFAIKRDLFKKKMEEFMKFENEESVNQQARIDRYKDKVWNTFTKNGKITQIPAQKQKRWILFERILAKFEFGKEYNELEVNKIIKNFNDDYCMIRRSFIEERVMHRDNGIYKISKNYEDFRNGKQSASVKHGMKESFEQSIRDKFGVI